MRLSGQRPASSLEPPSRTSQACLGGARKGWGRGIRRRARGESEKGRAFSEGSEVPPSLLRSFP
eukprot:5728193-Pyramimonas_sp.AAC.1